MYIASLKRSENYKAQPYQYASSSKQILKAKAKPFPPCTHCNFNDHRLGGMLAESSQSSKSSIGVKFNTCGSTIHSTNNHNDFDHFKRGEKIQAIKAREPTKVYYLCRHIREPICHVFIHNHKDNLCKFDAKADDGYFLGYSFVLKPFRVINTRRQQVEETYHVTFDESMEAIRFTNTSVDEIGIDDSSRYSSASTSSHPAPHDRWSKDQHIKLVNIIGDPSEGMFTRNMATKLIATSTSECIFANFLSEIEPKKVYEALKHPGWIDAMQELNQFYRNKVWNLVPPPYRKIAIGSKWVFRNKKDEHVARMEAIRIFLAFATYMNFNVYQMDVKSAFLSALYGLKLAPKACSSVKTPMVHPNNVGPNLVGKPVNETSYRGMIGPLMYLTAIRPDILFSIILCAIYQSNPKESHLTDVKKILRYLKGTPTLEKSTSGACQILGGKLVYWSAKKQPLVAMSSAEAKYVAAAGCYASILWMKSQLIDFAIHYKMVLGENYFFTEQVNSIQQLLAYCLITGTHVDIKEIIYTDLGCDYTQDIVTPALPKSQGLEASRALSKKSKKPKSKKTPAETKATSTPKPIEGSEQSHSISSGTVPNPQDPERNIQLAGTGLPFISPNEGIHSSQPFPEGTTTAPKDSVGNKQPIDMGLTSTASDEGMTKTTSRPKGSLRDKDSGEKQTTC
ncbi:retrovirus-related pol polyprotein from transposon TNT 1-94 [Tanacetum coccineum]